MVLRRRDVELPVRAADDTLSGYLDKLAREMQQELTDGSFVDKGKQVRVIQISGNRIVVREIEATVG